MPQRLGSPGVYIEEIPSGRRVIRSVATSIGAFVDFFREGPMNTPVRVFGTGDFERVFGRHDTRSEASFAIPQFFLNGGPEAWVVRVASGSFAASTTDIADEGGTDILTVDASNPGEWGDTLRVEIDHNVNDTGASDLRFNMRVIRFASPAGNSQGLLSETFLNLSMDESSARFVKTIVDDESQLVQVEVIGDLDGTVRPAANGTVSGELSLDQLALDTLGGGQTLDLAVGTATASATLTWNNGDVATLSQLRGRLEAAIRRPGAARSR